MECIHIDQMLLQQQSINDRLKIKREERFEREYINHEIDVRGASLRPWTIYGNVIQIHETDNPAWIAINYATLLICWGNYRKIQNDVEIKRTYKTKNITELMKIANYWEKTKSYENLGYFVKNNITMSLDPNRYIFGSIAEYRSVKQIITWLQLLAHDYLPVKYQFMFSKSSDLSYKLRRIILLKGIEKQYKDIIVFGIYNVLKIHESKLNKFICKKEKIEREEIESMLFGESHSKSQNMPTYTYSNLKNRLNHIDLLKSPHISYKGLDNLYKDDFMEVVKNMCYTTILPNMTILQKRLDLIKEHIEFIITPIERDIIAKLYSDEIDNIQNSPISEIIGEYLMHIKKFEDDINISSSRIPYDQKIATFIKSVEHKLNACDIYNIDTNEKIYENKFTPHIAVINKLCDEALEKRLFAMKKKRNELFTLYKKLQIKKSKEQLIQTKNINRLSTNEKMGLKLLKSIRKLYFLMRDNPENFYAYFDKCPDIDEIMD